MPEEIYVSTDIEADGPIPGPNSMLSFASVALRADKTVIDEFTANLQSLPDAKPHPRTMLWWESFREALARWQSLGEPLAAMQAKVGIWRVDIRTVGARHIGIGTLGIRRVGYFHIGCSAIRPVAARRLSGVVTATCHQT